jgi:hypothetical protein
LQQKIKFMIGLLIVSGTAQTQMPKPNCYRQTPTDEVIYNSDFKWGLTLPEMMERFDKMYAGPKRLDRHAYYDEQKKKYFLPYADAQGGPIELPVSFIDSVTKHIEKAFQRKFIDAVFFPDMGHSHFLIPEAKYKKVYANIPTEKSNVFYKTLFMDPEIKVAYHTAEQLQSLDKSNQPLADQKIQWRFYTRNLIGDNGGEKKIEIYNALDQSKANTLGSVPGFYWWGAGFNLSANKNGCFSYKKEGQIFYYDISIYDLPIDPSLPVENEP